MFTLTANWKISVKCEKWTAFDVNAEQRFAYRPINAKNQIQVILTITRAHQQSKYELRFECSGAVPYVFVVVVDLYRTGIASMAIENAKSLPKVDTKKNLRTVCAPTIKWALYQFASNLCFQTVLCTHCFPLNQCAMNVAHRLCCVIEKPKNQTTIFYTLKFIIPRREHRDIENI